MTLSLYVRQQVLRIRICILDLDLVTEPVWGPVRRIRSGPPLFIF